MDTGRFLNHPLFKNCERTYQPSDYLFRQGEEGLTMFIVMAGKVRLLDSDEGRTYTVSIVGPGEFLGEKAIMEIKAYSRAFSAVAITSVTAIELSHNEVLKLERQAPYLLKSLLKQSFEITDMRLARANRLAAVLRSSDNNERLLSCIAFIAESFGSQGENEQDIQVFELADGIAAYIDMDLDQIKIRLQDLVLRGILADRGADAYSVRLEALKKFAAQRRQSRQAAA